jgi:DNA invertase Pin-like site-specific DNA recombinase
MVLQMAEHLDVPLCERNAMLLAAGFARVYAMRGRCDVDAIDDDLGCTASGVQRPGFERMLGAICGGKIDAIFSIDPSRSARRPSQLAGTINQCVLQPLAFQVVLHLPGRRLRM